MEKAAAVGIAHCCMIGEAADSYWMLPPDNGVGTVVGGEHGAVGGGGELVDTTEALLIASDRRSRSQGCNKYGHGKPDFPCLVQVAAGDRLLRVAEAIPMWLRLVVEAIHPPRLVVEAQQLAMVRLVAMATTNLCVAAVECYCWLEVVVVLVCHPRVRPRRIGSRNPFRAMMWPVFWMVAAAHPPRCCWAAVCNREWDDWFHRKSHTGRPRFDSFAVAPSAGGTQRPGVPFPHRRDSRWFRRL